MTDPKPLETTTPSQIAGRFRLPPLGIYRVDELRPPSVYPTTTWAEDAALALRTHLRDVALGHSRLFPDLGDAKLTAFGVVIALILAIVAYFVMR